MPFNRTYNAPLEGTEYAYYHDLNQLRGRTARVVSILAAHLVRGAALSIHDVTAGNGQVIEWAAVKSGQTLLEGADAFDTAELFLKLVGTRAALHAVRKLRNDFIEPAGRVIAKTGSNQQISV